MTFYSVCHQPSLFPVITVFNISVSLGVFKQIGYIFFLLPFTPAVACSTPLFRILSSCNSTFWRTFQMKTELLHSLLHLSSVACMFKLYNLYRLAFRLLVTFVLRNSAVTDNLYT